MISPFDSNADDFMLPDSVLMKYLNLGLDLDQLSSSDRNSQNYIGWIAGRSRNDQNKSDSLQSIWQSLIHTHPGQPQWPYDTFVLKSLGKCPIYYNFNYVSYLCRRPKVNCFSWPTHTYMSQCKCIHCIYALCVLPYTMHATYFFDGSLRGVDHLWQPMGR